jgi:hypothetical protein
MKLSWAIILGLAVSAPIMALPSRWSSDADNGITRYMVGDLGSRGSHVLIACPQGQGADIKVAINGVFAPSDSEIGFRAAGRTLVMRSNDDGKIQTRSSRNAAAFGALWDAIRAGDRLDISFTNGVSATLPLNGSARALPAMPCAVDYRPGRANLKDKLGL